MHRSAEEILGAIRDNLDLVAGLITAARDLAMLIDTDLKEAYERKLYKAAGHEHYRYWIFEKVGLHPNSIRCILDRIWRDHQLLTDPASREPGFRRREFPNRDSSSRTPKLRRGRVSAADRLAQRSRGAPGADGADSGDPTVGWLGTILDQLDPEAAVDRASPEQLEALQAWMDDFMVAGRAVGFCAHHPDYRSADGRVCMDCGKQVLR